MTISDDGSNSVHSWIAVNTQPNREQTAATHLRNQGYGVYFPVMRRQIRHARQVRTVLRPLFPGYLFAALSSAQMRWRPILSTVGVRTVVCMGDAPSFVPASFIVDLKRREENGVICQSPQSFQIGDAVHIARGAFDGLAGTIIALSENDRLIVLMNFLNRPVRVTLPGDFLSVA